MAIYSRVDTNRNARGLAAFGATHQGGTASSSSRIVRKGASTTVVYTVGYEKRDGAELMALLRKHGIKVLADVRERPLSRKPDFRGSALRASCEANGLEYQLWSVLGSTSAQREELHASGDFKAFERQFHTYAKRELASDLSRLAMAVQQKPTALLCYERAHEDCHRGILATMVGDSIDANVVAIS